MIHICRMGHAAFATDDVDRLVTYYTRVMGLSLVAREKDRAFLATQTGQIAVELQRGDSPHCAKLSFELAAGDDLKDVARKLNASGITSTIKGDSIPGVPQVLSFEDVKGTTIELFTEWETPERGEPGTGIGSLKLGHVAFIVPDPKAAADYYVNVLGFRISDWIDDFFVFLRCNADHHTVNFIRGDGVHLHHYAFEVRDVAHLNAGCDVLGEKQIPVAWGPLRLGPGHSICAFHRNPDDQMVEIYAELDQMKDERLGYFEPRPWHKDLPQCPKVWKGGRSYIWGQPPSPEFLRRRQGGIDPRTAFIKERG
jgi:catechol 2,3-dioxygenase-like lactoylglutathione lyase family enzyme